MSSEPTTLTGDEITVYRVLVIRRDMILKIDTGMSLTSAASGLEVARRDGITTARKNRAGLVDVNAWLAQRGIEPKWSRRYPNG